MNFLYIFSFCADKHWLSPIRPTFYKPAQQDYFHFEQASSMFASNFRMNSRIASHQQDELIHEHYKLQTCPHIYGQH